MCNEDLNNCCPCHSDDPTIKATADGECDLIFEHDFPGSLCWCSFTEQEAATALTDLGFTVVAKENIP